jgi:tetratricopeptide (TPR) repeat protein
MKTTSKYRMIRIAAGFIFCFINYTVVGQDKGITITSIGNDQKVVIIDNPEEFSESYKHYQAGIRYDSEGDYEHAINEYSIAISLNKEFADAYDHRGITYTKMIKYRKAVKDFNTAIKLNKSFFEAYNHRGIALYCLGDFEKALCDYDKALEINPSYAKAYYNRGILKMYMDNEQGAINDFKIASQFNDTEAQKYLSQIQTEEAKVSDTSVSSMPVMKFFGN